MSSENMQSDSFDPERAGLRKQDLPDGRKWVYENRAGEAVYECICDESGGWTFLNLRSWRWIYLPWGIEHSVALEIIKDRL